jgi:hypothetical protein
MSDDSEFIRIGAGSDLFTLSLTISSMTGAGNLFGSLVGPFWLSYKVFGLLVQTDQFHDLHNPGFLPIRDIFRMKSSVADISTYLSSLGRLEVFLCSPGTVLGVTLLRMDALVPADCDERYFTEAEATGGFVIRPLNPPALAQSYDQGTLIGIDAMVNGVVRLHRHAISASSRRVAAPAAVGDARPAGTEGTPGVSSSLQHAEADVADTAVDVGREAELALIIRRLQSVGGVMVPNAADPPSEASAAVRVLEQQLSDARAAIASKDEELLRLTRQQAAAEALSRSETTVLQERVRTLEQAVQEKDKQAQEALAVARGRDRELEDAQRRIRDLESTSTRTGESLASRESELRAQVEDLRARLTTAQDHCRSKDAETDSLNRRLRELDLAWQEKCAAEIKRADTQRTQELEAAWAEREKQRVAELLAAQENYQRLEMRLRKALAEAERRDSSLKLLTAEAERTLSAKLAELEVSKRHVKEEADHVVRLERQKHRALTDEVAQAHAEVEQHRRRERTLEEELLKMRDKQLKGPDAELQRRIATLEADKAALVRLHLVVRLFVRSFVCLFVCSFVR